MRIRFGRWTGTQDPFPADVSADAVLEELSDDLLSGVSPLHALQQLVRRGLPGRAAGLDELRRRVEQARCRELSRMGLEGPLREIERELEAILERERRAVEFDADDEARARRQDELDRLPPDAAGRLGALQQHDWADAGAERDFQDLLERVRRDVAQATFGRLAGALGAMTPADLERMNAFLGELNALAAKRDRGEDVQADFAAFKQRYADLIDGDPETLDELLEELARRMAAMSSLMAGLDSEQRAQLSQLAGQVLGDLDLSFQAQQLADTLQRQFPGLGWNQAVPGAPPFAPDEGSLVETVDWVEHLQELDDLGEALRQDYPGARLDDVDEERLRAVLGDEAVRDLRALREVERVLEEAGAAQRQHGQLELTPRGIRRLGERSLARIYDRVVTGGVGSHRTIDAGGDGELTGSTRPLRFGDPFRLDVGRTVQNAILRGGGATGLRESALRRVRLDAGDFELAEAERRVRAVTVLLLDMSFSMPLRGNWVPAKRVALALQSLVATRFPEDEFFIVGFSDYARRLQPKDLLATGWERVYGTNMQHAFMIARRLLSAHPGAEKQVIMVTDGEPTAHLEGDRPMFAWPPEPKTLRLTLAEAGRLARTGATLNVFLLDHDPGAAAFVERMVSSCGGRIFYPDLDDLGSMVVRDFLEGRRH